MKIINQDKNTILAKDAALANTVFTRIVGLLGRSGLKEGEALVIRPCTSIHTFFMGFAIDIIFVDKNGRVIKLIYSMEPFKLTGIYFKASFAIELPQGIIQATSTKKGDRISVT